MRYEVEIFARIINRRKNGEVRKAFACLGGVLYARIDILRNDSEGFVGRKECGGVNCRGNVE